MIVTLTIEHALHIAYKMRDIDKREVMASGPERLIMDFAYSCVRYGGWALIDKTGEPVAMGGVAKQWNGLGNAWLVGTDQIERHMIEITRAIKKEINKPEWRRIQAWSACFHKESHAWLERIGFVNAHTLKSFGKGGEDFYLFEKFN